MLKANFTSEVNPIQFKSILITSLMISEMTVDLLDCYLRVAGHLRISPFSFDVEALKVSEIVKKGSFCGPPWRIITWSCVLIEIMFSFSIVYVISTFPTPMHEIVVLVCFQILCSLAFFIQYLFLTKTHEIELVYNHMLVFDETFRK